MMTMLFSLPSGCTTLAYSWAIGPTIPRNLPDGTTRRTRCGARLNGAMAVLRTVCKVGRDTRFTTFTDAMNSLRKSLATLPAQLRLETARRLAVPKIAALERFIDSVDTESMNALD
jgi:hypothetical protein